MLRRPRWGNQVTGMFSEQPSYLFGEQIQALLGKREKEINGKTQLQEQRGASIIAQLERNPPAIQESACNSGIACKAGDPAGVQPWWIQGIRSGDGVGEESLFTY